MKVRRALWSLLGIVLFSLCIYQQLITPLRTRFERQDSDLAVQIKGMCNIIQQGGEKVTLIDAIGNRVSIPMDFCRTYEVVASLLRSACTLTFHQMLSDIIHFYFRHQRPPGSRFVQQNRYQLVHGADRKTVDPVLWNSCVIPGTAVEMSIVIPCSNKMSDALGSCPRCRTRYDGHRKNGWVTWQVSSCLTFTTCLSDYSVSCRKPFHLKEGFDGDLDWLIR
jgi:hypothetical protein